MNRIKFEYNLTKDAYNYIRTILFPASHGNSKNLNFIPQNLQKEVKKLYRAYPTSHSRIIKKMPYKISEPVIKYLEKRFKRKDVISKKKEELEKRWRELENKYFQVLSKLMGKPIYSANYICYLTTIYSCPCFEKENWFMVSAFSSLENQVYVVSHEFMHLQFIYWYKDYCLQKGLTEKEFWHLKEAITFLLNESEFSDVIKFQDEGYAIHKKFRKKLKSLWVENKNFHKFIEKFIEEKEDYFSTLK